MGIARRPCPTADQAAARHAIVQHLERRQQFRFEQGAAAAFIGQRRERTDEVEVAGIGTVVGFMAIDRDHDFLRHAGFRLYPGKPGAVRLISGAATADARGIDMLTPIGFEIGNGGIGPSPRLVLIQLDNPWVGRERGEDGI